MAYTPVAHKTGMIQVEVNTVGVRMTARKMEERGLRAANLLPVWEVAEQTILNYERRRFDTMGFGAWAPQAASTIQRWGPHPLMDLTGKLRAALTQRGADGQRSIKTPRTFVFGIRGNGPVYYGKFHQGGTKHMPKRTIISWRGTRLAIEKLVADYIVEGKL